MSAHLRPGLLRTAVALGAGLAILIPLAPAAAAAPADRPVSAAAPADPVSDLLATLTGGAGDLGGLGELLGGVGGLGGLGEGLGALGDLSLLQTLLASIVDIDPSALQGDDPDFGGAFGPAEPDLGDLLKAALAQLVYELLTAIVGDEAPAQP